MENSGDGNPLENITAKLLALISPNCVQEEATLDEKCKKFSDIMTKNATLYEDISKMFVKIPKGHITADAIIAENTKFIGTLRKEANRQSAHVQHSIKSYADMLMLPLEFDEWTMRSYEEIVAETERLEAAIVELKQESEKQQAELDKKCEEIEGEIADTERAIAAVEETPTPNLSATNQLQQPNKIDANDNIWDQDFDEFLKGLGFMDWHY